MNSLANYIYGEDGQGTVEYVGLILLVSMLMVALVVMVARKPDTSQRA